MTQRQAAAVLGLVVLHEDLQADALAVYAVLTRRWLSFDQIRDAMPDVAEWRRWPRGKARILRALTFLCLYGLAESRELECHAEWRRRKHEAR